MMEREEFRKHFTRLAEGQGELSGQAYLQDIYQNQPVDFDGLALDLERYRYKMEPFPDIDVLVKKGKKEAKITSQSYELLSSFKHEIFLPVENFLPVGNGWLLVQMPCVDGTLLGLARSEQRNLLFGGDGVQRGFSTSFRNMLMTLLAYGKMALALVEKFLSDLSSLIWKLEHKQLYPRKFSINDVYIKMVNGLPKVRVILTQVEQVRDYSDEKRNTQRHGENPCPHQHMELGSSAGLIQKMEEWDPEIWTKIYRVIGPFTFECKKP
ncbi:hypothetical protein EJB05_48247, partial [Eragrostis curvula]